MTIAFEDELVDCSPQLTTAFRFVQTRWKAAESPSANKFPPTKITLITWNVNAKRRLRTQRLLAAIHHIKEKRFLDANPPPPSCICLQEVHADALPTLLASPWIQEHFLITPISSQGWKASFGLVTLVSKDVPVSTVFTVGLPMTSLGRQALFTDLHVLLPSGRATRTLRIGNTHLESRISATDRRSREKQLYQIARLLNVPNVDVFICAGSMCSILKDDDISIAKAGFADVWRRPHNSETWGHQPVEPEMRAGRLDRILYFPTPGVTFSPSGRVGVGLKCEMPTNPRQQMFVSDHTGVWVDVSVLDTNDTA